MEDNAKKGTDGSQIGSDQKIGSDHNLTKTRGRSKQCAFFHEESYRGVQTPYEKIISIKHQKEKRSNSHLSCHGSRQIGLGGSRNIIFYGCLDCEEGVIKWRCGGCYEAIRKAILSKMGQNAAKKYEEGGLDFVGAFLRINFTNPQIATESFRKNLSFLDEMDDPIVKRLAMKRKEEIGSNFNDASTTSASCNRKRNAQGDVIHRQGIRLLIWKKGCIHCKDFSFPSIPQSRMQLSLEVLQQRPLQPIYKRLENVLLLNSKGSIVNVKSVGVLIYTVYPIMSQGMSQQFKHYYANETPPGLGKKRIHYSLLYDTAEHWMKYESSEGTKSDQHWVILRTGGPDNDSQVLSIQHEDGLIQDYDSSTTNRVPSAISKGILSMTRYASCTAKELVKSNDRIKLPILIKKGKLRSSAWRMNRRGGSSGHAGGSSMISMRKHVCSPYLIGNTPFSIMSCVVLPTRMKQGLWIEMSAFYFRTTQKSKKWMEENPGSVHNLDDVCCSPMSALPRRGWLTPGKQVVSMCTNTDSRVYSPQPDEKEYLVKQLAGNCSAALLLHHISKSYPSLSCSEKATHATFSNMVETTGYSCDEQDSVLTQINNLKVGDAFNIWRLMEKSEFSTLIDTVAGHADHYSADKKKDSELEGKITLIMGAPDTSIDIVGYQKKGLVPPGFLAYPEYGVATVCYANQDLEYHDLSTSKVIHTTALIDHGQSTEVSRNAAHIDNRIVNEQGEGGNDEAYSRGVWTRTRSRAPTFYPQGAALTQYEKKNRQTQTHREQRDRDRLARRRNRNNQG